MKYLQVLKDEKWEFVFCYNPIQGIITTKDPKKALRERDLEYFQNKLGNDTFRATDNKY